MGLLALYYGRRKKGSKWAVLVIVLVFGAAVGISLSACGPVVPTPVPDDDNQQQPTQPSNENESPTQPGNDNGNEASTPESPVETPRLKCAIEVPLGPDETEIDATVQELVDYIFNNGKHPYKHVWGEADLSKVKEYVRWIMDVAANAGLNTNHLAYIYATTHVESQWFNFTEIFPAEADPEEYFERQYGRGSSLGSQLGNTEFGDGYLYMGRGFIHLTGRGNYAKAGSALGLGTLLVDYPEKASYNEASNRTSLDPYNHITNVAVFGMSGGWFTGQKLSDFDNADGSYRFYDARAIINWPGAQGGDPRQQAGDLGKDFAEILSRHCPLGGVPAGLMCVVCR